MADILIRGIPKPTDCGKCFVGDRTMCADGCPLVELPEHGDLIDRSELKTNMIDDTFGSAARYVNLVQILDAPVIVPANKGESE